MSVARTAVLHATGGPEAIAWEDRPLPAPGPGEVLLRHHAIGVNYIDIYHRSGLYPLSLPSGLGSEGAGVIEAVGEGVEHVAPGDRVAYAGGPLGAYAEARVMPAAPLVKLPDAISFEEAAAVMLKGLTVHYLFRRTVPIRPGDTVLFLPAAGGTGLIACQWARSEGIRLIGAAGGAAKCALAREHGAAETIDMRTQDLAAEARRLTGGRGVDVVMDGVGRDSFIASLDALRPLGTMISFGNASGKVEPFDIGLLAAKGSLMLTRPTLFTHIADPAVLRRMAAELFEKVISGAIRPRIDQRRPLAEAAAAHRALEARATTGATVLLP
ncbi:NADPH:quinone reductase [Rubellimicrobium thermophilum DSM 16684]|uniref:NADPH:quinone reductase n=1 Tax=Rubellimicrobium thermophilum DSM 16684 TaxID=1123069 RepID=S9SN51_9RHOB|nr:quinone oxidoreductase [Rubellimicrobium thermophilum]EPX87874.1 NADPH:quinone reductase [Rubellimicrobium thermophilum DSM 16684]